MSPDSNSPAAFSPLRAEVPTKKAPICSGSRDRLVLGHLCTVRPENRRNSVTSLPTPTGSPKVRAAGSVQSVCLCPAPEGQGRSCSAGRAPACRSREDSQRRVASAACSAGSPLSSVTCASALVPQCVVHPTGCASRPISTHQRTRLKSRLRRLGTVCPNSTRCRGRARCAMNTKIGDKIKHNKKNICTKFHVIPVYLQRAPSQQLILHKTFCTTPLRTPLRLGGPSQTMREGGCNASAPDRRLSSHRDCLPL